jgi:ectoine hydroxylase-related dioxygenase (phytanoyl-CoA dioxygenase family)
MLTVDCRETPEWAALVAEAVRHAGVAIVTGVVPDPMRDEARERMYAVRRAILRDVGEERLTRAGEMGVLRLMFRYDPFFFRFLELPAVLAAVDRTVSETAILHLQNGFILPSHPRGTTPKVFQNRFHMDFPRVFNGHPMSVNVLIAVDPFTAENGCTLVVPGTHQKVVPPDPAYLAAAAVGAECPAGAALVFDSTLWHAAGANVSGADRLAINHQFTRSYVKQQVDYVRAVGESAVRGLPPRSQQLLGWYTRVVTSLDEYYQPEADRLYRRGQG